MSDHRDFILNLKENPAISFNQRALMLYRWAVDNDDELEWIWEYLNKMVDENYVVESIYQDILNDNLSGVLAKTRNIKDAGGSWFWEEEPDKFRDFTPEDMERVLSSILDRLGDEL